VLKDWYETLKDRESRKKIKAFS